MLEFWIFLLAVQVLVMMLCIVPVVRKSLLGILNHPLSLGLGMSAARIAMAGMFLAACYPKIMSPYDFSELVAQYQMLPSWSVNFFSLWLPVFELVVALGLLFTKWHKEFTIMLTAMMVMFIIALAQSLVRDLGITCGCFDIEGAMDKGDAWTSLLRDLALMPAILWMWMKGKNRYIWNILTKSPG